MNLNYPQQLPISREKDAIIAAIQAHQVVIVAGDTGSGKTTQLPKMCLEAFPDDERFIGCTQPRRIAATSVSNRVAEELGSFSGLVGYKIRFHDHTTGSTRIKFMTDGVLLAETRHDRILSSYGVIIIDEAHERSLNIDFLLGYLKQLLSRRPDLKLIITSATIDTEAFSKHFDKAPVISVSGRTYGVDVQYRAPQEDGGGIEGSVEQCVEVVEELCGRRPDGDILVFLATEREIRECCRLLENRLSNTTVLPLFGRLPSGDQARIFRQSRTVKVIVATNVAETSVTVPGIRYVVDSGYARISHYNVQAKTTSLPVSKISRASCDQRKGRCGRIGPGLCIRLYSEEDYTGRVEYTVPEIQRSNLAEVILQMTSLGLGDPTTFPFIDPPTRKAIHEGYRLLRELGAIDIGKKLTKNGRFMANLPIDPCISRVILAAKENGCLREIKIISAVLAIQDPRVRPAESEKAADTAHKQFQHPHSDFMTLLNIWDSFHDTAGKAKSWSRLKRFCKTHFLSFQRMREWFDLYDQLDRLLSKRQGGTDNTAAASYEQIHRSLLSGFLRNVAKKKKGKVFQGSYNQELMIFPGSGQFARPPEWIVGATFLETSNLYALTVAHLEVEWIEPVAGDLCKYSWNTPRWQKKSGQVVADETVSLFGLIISSGRTVNFARRHSKNIAQARDIFIQSALIPGEIHGSYSFLQHNLAKIRGWQESEAKLRIRNLVVDDLSLHNFYDARLPEQVYDRRTLNLYLKRSTHGSKKLQMRDRDILLRDLEDNELVNFPQTRNIGNMESRLEYHFEPGTDRDGVTFRLPISFAASVSTDHFDWLVPGLLREKITFLLKSLPKSVRKKLVPVSERVNQLLDDLDFGRGPLLPSLEQSILKQFGFLVNRADWNLDFPQHLRPRFLLFDEEGKERASGRELKGLLGKINPDSTLPVSAAYSKLDQQLIDRWEGFETRTWDFEGLPKEITTFTRNGEISGFLYSAIVAQGKTSCVRVVFEKDKEAAEVLNRKGTLYLLGLEFKEQAKALKKLCSTSLSGPSALFFSRMGKPRSEIVEATFYHILAWVAGPIPPGLIQRELYDKKISTLRQKGVLREGRIYLEQLLGALRKRREVEQRIKGIFITGQKKGHFLPPLQQEFLDNLEDILPVDFLSSGSPKDFQQLSRQFQGLLIRVERFYVNPAKDAIKARQIQPYLEKLKQLLERRQSMSQEAMEELDRYREMVGEFRIALFSPEIKVRISVSPKKLEKQWQALLARY